MRRVSLAEANLPFNFPRLSWEKVIKGDTLVMLDFEAPTAGRGSEARGSFPPQKEKD